MPVTTGKGKKSINGAREAPFRPFDLKFGGGPGNGRVGPLAKRNGAWERGGVRRARSQGGTCKKKSSV